ncbi:UNVERIFIED_ORG: hypothetical protein BDK47_13831 [Anoxybacillus amylolyticus]|uniref:Uncharacterized protein n=1 Tax=Geobacillus kaustophilus GBlys TaxID=1337888 RepID=S4NMW6_GEOKU|nr:hypothetical protein GBL_2524 [Geobacillus kaustophilus GBlys]
MNRLKIIHDCGWPSQTLHKQEREMKNAHLRQCASAVRLVIGFGACHHPKFVEILVIER